MSCTATPYRGFKSHRYRQVKRRVSDSEIRRFRVPGSASTAVPREGGVRRSVLEVDEEPPVVLAVLLHPVVPSLDVLAVEEPEDPLLQLAAALAGDDLDRLRPGALRLREDPLQRTVDVRAPVVDVV